MRIREDNVNKGFAIDDIAPPYASIQVFRRDFDWHMASHCHTMYQLIFVTSGTLHVLCGQDEWTIGPGQAHVLPPNVYHTLSSDGYEQLGIDVYCDSEVRNILPLLEDYLPQPAVIDCPEALTDIQELIDKCYLGNRISVARVVSLLDAVIIKALEAHTRVGAMRFDHKLSQYLNAHIAQKLTLRDVAKEFHMSVPHLERLARKHFNNSVIELRNQRRLTLAKMLLVSTAMPIGEIAEHIGYQDPAHFSTFFKKRTNKSPSEYREESALQAGAGPEGLT